MKLNKIIMTAAIALVGAASAHAAAYTAGDLILGIYDTAQPGVAPLEFNLGAFSNYANGGGSGLTLNINDEMTSTFGANWASLSTIKWGLAALVDASTTQIALGIPTNVVLTKLSASAAVKGQVNPYTTAYSNATTAVGDGYSVSSNSIKTYDTTSDFSTGKNLVVPITTNDTLDLYFYAGSANGVYQNTSFTIADNGNILAVPEPSSYAMMALGSLGLLRMFRRRAIVNA